jgi:regulator of replication initiation timing
MKFIRTKDLVNECAELRVENSELREELELVKRALEESEELVRDWSGDHE